VRDGVFFAKAGHPTLVFVHDNFEKAARAQAKALGLPDLDIYVYPQNKPGDFAAEERHKGMLAANALVPRLLRDKD
jgi:hypothetical protein